MTETNYDFISIGSGSAAFAAAIEAVSAGARVAMVERGQIGGTCVNIGCVPSKTLLRAGEINHYARQNPFKGLNTSTTKVDFVSLIKQKDELVTELRQQKYINLIEEYGFDLIHGEAKFIDKKTVAVEGKKYTAESFLIATGASPFIPDIPGLKEVNYLTSTNAFELDYLPDSIAIIGVGYVALELGELFNSLGSKVTLMRRSQSLMKGYEPEVAEAVNKFLAHKGIEVITGVNYKLVEKTGSNKRIHLFVNNEERIIEADEVLVAAGRRPNTKALNLNKIGVKIGHQGEVIVNEYLRTSKSNIYAAGDVTMGPTVCLCGSI